MNCSKLNEEIDVDGLITLSRDTNSAIRLNALKQMCPCKVRQDIDPMWDRIFEMVKDSERDIRYQVLHTICDGSPLHLEAKVKDALDVFNRDLDKDIKRKAHKVMASYLRTGRWNVL